MRCGEYGKETEKSAKYMKQPAAQALAVYNAGNHSRQFTIQVPVLNADGTIKLDENGMIIGEEVTERYEWYQTHRNQHKAGGGLWTVPKNVEGIIFFLKCRHYGAFTHWKAGAHKGWGICNYKGQAQIIGQGVTSDIR